ncbi:MAG: hypothetical protein LBC98_09650 [Prevotellaceae bacterium]|jgi:hypothetical protein|nr:hypothetical protein [Prevotellaceae bacterium]
MMMETVKFSQVETYIKPACVAVLALGSWLLVLEILALESHIKNISLPLPPK